MKNLVLSSHSQNHTTLVDNHFIDCHMVKANGEFVKVYLFLLRHLNASPSVLTISAIADSLDNTEKDILRALNYWEKEGLLSLQYDESDHSLCGIAFCPVPPCEGGGRSCAALSYEDTARSRGVSCEGNGYSTESQTPVTSQMTDPAPVAEPVSDSRGTAPTSIKAFRDRKEFQQLLFVAEQYIGRPLTRTDIDTISYFFDQLHFSADLIEYLIEYCVENQHTSMHYIKKVALAWADAHVTTVEEARATSSIYNKNCYTVLNAFGIRGRGPAASEIAYIKKWTEQYGFTLDIIKEACDRTMNSIHQPSFDYTDKILSKWLTQHVRVLSDIERIDTAFRQEKENKRRAAVPKPAANIKTKFNNFNGRSYDIDSLEERLLKTR